MIDVTLLNHGHTMCHFHSLSQIFAQVNMIHVARRHLANHHNQRFTVNVSRGSVRVHEKQIDGQDSNPGSAQAQQRLWQVRDPSKCMICITSLTKKICPSSGAAALDALVHRPARKHASR